MACCSCGLRQKDNSGYCTQCGCPLGALAPPRLLGRTEAHHPQRLPALGPAGLSGAQAAALGLLCAGLGWLPLYFGLLCCVLSVLLGSIAVRRLRPRRGALLWAAWAVVALGGACAVPALSAF